MEISQIGDLQLPSQRRGSPLPAGKLISPLRQASMTSKITMFFSAYSNRMRKAVMQGAGTLSRNALRRRLGASSKEEHEHSQGSD